MHIFEILFGIGMISYGILSIFIRYKHPEKFGKLEPMKKIWGERVGIIIHIVGYTIIPLLVGFMALIAGIRGVSIF